MNRGDVVEVDWFYTDMSGSKVRLAVLVQGDVATFDQMRVIRTIGFLSDAAMRGIEECIKKILEVP